MSYLAQRALPDTRSRVEDLVRSWPALATAAGLAVLTGLVLQRWWQGADGLPLSWQLPPAEALFLLPAVPVVGLLGLRVVVAVRHRTLVTEQLAAAAARWSLVWALASAVWLLRTVTGLYGGGLPGLLRADNLPAVLGASTAAGPRVTTVWVALLVALFGSRLAGWRQSLGLLALVVATVVAAVPAVGVHAHGDAVHPLVQVAAGLQVAAVLVALGAVTGILHLRGLAFRLPHHLSRSGALVTAATGVLGAAVVTAGLLRPAGPPAAWLAAAQLAAVALVVLVGYRHRGRTVAVVGDRPATLVLALAAAELVVLGAVLAVGVALPLV